MEGAPCCNLKKKTPWKNMPFDKKFRDQAKAQVKKNPTGSFKTYLLWWVFYKRLLFELMEKETYRW